MAKLFGRNKKRILAALFHPSRIAGSLYAIRFFQRSTRILRAYLTRTCPDERYIQMRSGYGIHLTGDIDDLVTVLIVLGRRDYGCIPEDGVVIDVGAHLGAFSLYAASRGARITYAYEPDAVLYDTLLRNISHNGLENRVRATQAAVIGSGPNEVTFYPEGNASGHIGKRADDTDGVTIAAVSLANIVAENRIERVSVLKLDCEGSEYDIIADTPRDVWDRIERVCLEYHFGRVEEIRCRFLELGFRLSALRKHTDEVGLMFFDRSR